MAQLRKQCPTDRARERTREKWRDSLSNRVELLEAGEDEIKYAQSKKLLAGLPQKQIVVKTYSLCIQYVQIVVCSPFIISNCRICFNLSWCDLCLKRQTTK